MKSTGVGTQAAENQAPDVEHRTPYRLFLVHHTHWDREWWATFQDFRIRLVETIDELLATLDSDPQFRTFLLDGQTIVLRDYLEIRPENRERLAGYIRQGRIQCGPWYVLSDEFLVSGEAHIRNLWMGRRVARELGIPLLNVGYLPDIFGHIAQMPQILQGFGIDSAVMWRGRGGDADSVKSEFLWTSPDGSTVLAYWYPDGYYQMPFLHFDNPDRPYEDKLGRIFAAIERTGPRTDTDALLVSYGGDHQPIDRNLPGKIEEANAAIGNLGSIHWSTLDEFMEAVRVAHVDLATVRGEVRALGAEAPSLLTGVLSSRLYLKVQNHRCQTWLERFTEPMSTLAWLRTGRYDSGLLWKAWDLLLQNHPHDSICGCSIDPVHREMLTRFAAVQQIAEIVAEKAAQTINARLDTRWLAAEDSALVIHNTLAHTRTDWASVWIERSNVGPHTYALFDDAGCEVPFQVRDVEGHRPMTDRWEFSEIGFVASDVPGLGYRSYRLARRPSPLSSRLLPYTLTAPSAALKGDLRVTDLTVDSHALENQYLRVEVDSDAGTLTVTDKRSGEVYSGLNAFEDGGDAGDTYNFSPPAIDTVVRSTNAARVHVSAHWLGYARASLRVDLDWALPQELNPDRTSRSARVVETRISTLLTLTAGVPRVDIITEWENRTLDHRLRVLFPLGARAGASQAEGQFVVTERPVETPDPGNGWAETQAAAVPQTGWCAISRGDRGLLLANRGLPEYEVVDGGSALALTLLRAVGWLSRDDLLTRTGGAGPTIPTPEAQSTGWNRVQYSLVPFSGDVVESRAFQAAQDYLVPLYGTATDGHAGELPPIHGPIELAGDHTLVLSACKRAEAGSALVLRFWNASAHPTQARMCVHADVKAVRALDLQEEPAEADPMEADDGGWYDLTAGPFKILTVGIELVLAAGEPGGTVVAGGVR